MRTDITFILDRSGSMASIATDVQGGLSTFIAEQKKVEGEATFTLNHFDHEFENVFKGEDVSTVDISSYHFTPRGSTALLDAVGRGISETKSRISAMSKENRPDKVLFVIFTDGQENASHEITRPQLKELIEAQQKEDWDFVFMGANQDSFAEAHSFGIHAGSTVNYAATAVGTRSAFGDLSKSVMQYRDGSREASDMFDGQSEISE